MILYVTRVSRGGQRPWQNRTVIFHVVALMVTTAVLLLLTGTVSAQAGQGQITVKACQDQNADGY